MPQPRVPLDQWRALVAVVEKGGYAKAAAALHKSQSSVSYGVQQLESQLGVKAFKIAGRKAALTPTGELLYRRARHLPHQAAAPRQAAEKLAAGGGGGGGARGRGGFPPLALPARPPRPRQGEPPTPPPPRV